MLVPVMSKPYTRGGITYPANETGFAINFNDDGSITVFKNRQEGTTFQVGDMAEYDSFNLRYTGVITKITKKAVTIVAYKGSRCAETHRLNLHKFAWRNYAFSMEAVAKHNAIEMQCI